jgi:aryl-alcohol dehydrogenase-like predicted oxidoreductase
MIYNEIAATGCRVSRLGLGTVKFGRNQGVKYPEQFALPDDKTISTLLDIASEFGVNLLDTAPAYGSSEARLGKLLGPNRPKWLISTKVGESFNDGISSFNFSPSAVEKSIYDSLGKLATDYLDIVLVHSDGNDEHIIKELDTLETLDRLKTKGLIRCFGVSTKTIQGGMLALEYSDLAMIAYNLTYQLEQPVLDHALQLHKGIFVKKALASGQQPAGMSTISWLEDSLRFVFKHPAVTSVILGTISPDHLRDNLLLTERIQATSAGSAESN